MDPKATKPFQPPSASEHNKTSNKTLHTLRIPGIERLKKRTGGDEDTQTSLWTDLRLPLKRMAIGVTGLLLLAFLASGAINLVKGMMGGSPKTVAAESPAASASPASSPAATKAAAASTESCTNITAKMTQAKVSGKQVDKIFYQKHPERSNQPLTGQPADQALTQEWCAIANQLIEQSGGR